MIGLAKVGIGIFSFFIGFAFLLVVSGIVPPLVDVGEELFVDTDVASIVNFGVVILFVIFSCIVPAGFILQGLKESEEYLHGIYSILAGILFFIFSVILFVKGWYIFTSMYDLLQTGLISGIFAVSSFIIIALFTTIIPATLIIRGFTNA